MATIFASLAWETTAPSINYAEAVKSRFFVLLCLFRIDSKDFAGKMPALPALFAASSFLDEIAKNRNSSINGTGL